MPSSVGVCGSCEEYAIFGSSTVTFDGVKSVISNGNIGLSPGTSITVASGTLADVLKNGRADINTPNARECAVQRLAVINSGLIATCGTSNISVLDGLTLLPGVYCFETFSLSASATVTLDGTNAGGKWMFVAGSTLITGAIWKHIIIDIFLYLCLLAGLYGNI
jgi:hypothetical protein